ncbi:MAG: DUF4259 domain-containing protein [Pseudomonadota bacterium]
MGAWGAGAFDNDDALDWVADTAELGSDGVVASIEAALWPPVVGLEADDVEEGTAVLAACETIAVAFGRPGKGMTDDLRSELEPLLEGLAEKKGLPDLALRGVAHATREGSELVELWADDPDTHKEWRAAIDDLRARLQDARDKVDAAEWEATGVAPVAIVRLSDADEDKDADADADDNDVSPENALRTEVRQIYEDMMAELERVADTTGGDAMAEFLRHVARKLDLVHKDVSNMRYAIVDELQALTERIERLEDGGAESGGKGTP